MLNTHFIGLTLYLTSSSSYKLNKGKTPGRDLMIGSKNQTNETVFPKGQHKQSGRTQNMCQGCVTEY